jgi:hypothetical protein
MTDREKIDQQVHDLVDEANEILLAMALPGVPSSAIATKR